MFENLLVNGVHSLNAKDPWGMLGCAKAMNNFESKDHHIIQASVGAQVHYIRNIGQNIRFAYLSRSVGREKKGEEKEKEKRKKKKNPNPGSDTRTNDRDNPEKEQ